MTILAIDPGTEKSGFCHMQNSKILESGVLPNSEIRMLIKSRFYYDILAIEMIASYGMPVGKETFETCLWIGRFIECSNEASECKLVYRKDIKLHLCGSLKAKDANIRQAIIDKLGPQGTKKKPGPTYGVKSHAWSAVAVALTV